MKLKRVLALTCALVFLASPIAYAANGEVAVKEVSVAIPELVPTKGPVKAEAPKPVISEEEALKIAMETFGVDVSYGKPMVNFWQDQSSGTATWSFSWSPETHPDLAAKFYLNIGISAIDGSIISYSWSNQFGNEPKEAKFDRASALPKAQAWLEKLVPAERRASLKFVATGREMSDQLYFSWIRLVNDIPYYNNMASITIDQVTGDLQGFNLGWDEKLEFPKKADVVSLEQAEQTRYNTIGMDLLYQDFYHRIKGAEARVIYRPKQEGLMIDAATGKVIDWNGSDWAGDYKPVTIPAAPSTFVKPAKPLTQEEALAVVRAAIGGETLNAPSSSGSHERNTGKFDAEQKIMVWNFSWNNDKERAYTNVSVDATHGVIMECYTGQEWQPDEAYKDKTPKDEADARKLAIETFVKIRPDLINQVQLLDRPVTEKYLPPEYVQREYNFNFVRLVNGISYPSNYVNVIIDRFTGELRNIYSNWSYKQLPAATGIISSKDALAVMKQEAPLELTYVAIYPNKPMEGPVKPSIRLVYRARDSYGASGMIDAMNGHLLDYDGRDLTELRKGITDITDHEAKKEIETAVNQGIFATTDGKFNPQGTVTKGELAKAIVTAFDHPIMYEYMMKSAASSVPMPAAPSYADVPLDHPYAPYIDAAVQMGIFKPADPNSKFEPEAMVSKEEVALYVIRAMGFTFIDTFDAMISSGYTDHEKISNANRNAVGFLVGLKVLTKGGEFKPQTEMTRAELAKVIVNAAKVKMPGGPYPYFRG